MSQTEEKKEMELVKINGRDIGTVEDVKDFLIDQNTELVANSVNPIMQSTSMGVFWIGAILSHLRNESFHVDKGYEKGKMGFYQYCETYFNKTQKTVSKYINMFETLDSRGIKSKDIVGVVDPIYLFMLADNAAKLNDDEVHQFIDNAKHMNDEEFKNLFPGEAKKSNIESEEFKLKYIEEDLEAFKKFVEQVEKDTGIKDLSKLVLRLFTEYVRDKLGQKMDLRVDLAILLKNHSIDQSQALEVLDVALQEIKDSK